MSEMRVDADGDPLCSLNGAGVCNGVGEYVDGLRAQLAAATSRAKALEEAMREIAEGGEGIRFKRPELFGEWAQDVARAALVGKDGGT